MQEALEALLTELEMRLKQLIHAEETALEQAMSEEAQYKQDFEEARQAIYSDIDRLNGLRASL